MERVGLKRVYVSLKIYERRNKLSGFAWWLLFEPYESPYLGVKVAKSAHLSSVLCKKICCNNEIEETVYRTPAHELDEKLE